MKEEYLVYWNAAHEVPARPESKGVPARNGGRVWYAVSQSFTTEEEATARYESLIADQSVNGIHLAFRRWMRDWKEDRGTGVAVRVLATITEVTPRLFKVDRVGGFQDGQPLMVVRDGAMMGRVTTLAVYVDSCELALEGFAPSATRPGDMLVEAA